MYLFREDVDLKEVLRGRTKTYLAKVIGLSIVQLANIINRKGTTTKTTAYCITKALDRNFEIEDLFIKKEK